MCKVADPDGVDPDQTLEIKPDPSLAVNYKNKKIYISAFLELWSKNF